jgi:predicted AlkP superfamily pyrophosphatase or phosphodiesterase
MIKRILLSLYLLSYSIMVAAQTQGSKTLTRPKLVVGIVVDQMRWDYLYRYYDRYSEGGFKRLLREGAACENTFINYVPTVTAIGHSTIYTGSVPAIHGITGNDFFLEATGKKVYCTEDSTVSTVGSTSAAGRMSPRNLLAGTISDELKLATNFQSKVIGIALKDRGAILPAGHAGDAAYWLDDATGNWITSTYYMPELPKWVQQFNAQQRTAHLLDQDWNTLYPLATYRQSTPDSNRYEGRFAGTAAPVLPVPLSRLTRKNFDLIRTTPFGNTLTLEMAKAALKEEGLGRGTATDFLALSFSSTDYIGHKFGVNAVEVEDTYLRLDSDLSDLFTYLDKTVGKGQYTLFLTADHGAAHNPNFLQDHQMPAGFWLGGALLKELNGLLEKEYGVKGLVTSFSNYQVHLDHPLLERSGLNEEAVRKAIVRFLRKQPQVAFAADLEKLEEAHLPAPLKQSVINGYHRKRSGVITFILEPGWYSGTSANGTGTSHGTWNAYDAHIPLLWMGWGIQPGRVVAPVDMTDIVPTLATLLHIQQPNGCMGKPIPEVIRK